MKKQTKKLALVPETIRIITDKQDLLRQVGGGGTINGCNIYQTQTKGACG